MRNKPKPLLFVSMILLMAALACNAPGRPPSEDITPSTPISLATVAPTSAGSQTPTLAATPTQGSLPTTAPTSSGGGGTPERISFAPGGTSATVTGNVNGNKTIRYVINVGAGQIMTAKLLVTGGTGALGLTGPDGSEFISTASGETGFSGSIPTTGDYIITVLINSSGAASYSLEVTIPPLGSSDGSLECTVSNAAEVNAYRESSLIAEVWGVSPAGNQASALARTKDGWIGFDPGVAQAGNEGRARLRWYAPGTQLTFNPAGCGNNLPLVLSLASIENGTYFVMDIKNITLVNRVYGNPSFDPANTGGDVQGAGMGLVVGWGDMNGDGKEDVVITIGTNTGGTGTFMEFFAVVNNNGDPLPSEGLFLDDRGGVNAMTIDNGIVTAEVLIHGPGDPGCCPTLIETWLLQLVQATLKKIN